LRRNQSVVLVVVLVFVGKESMDERLGLGHHHQNNSCLFLDLWAGKSGGRELTERAQNVTAEMVLVELERRVEQNIYKVRFSLYPYGQSVPSITGNPPALRVETTSFHGPPRMTIESRWS
jgi:hypothetical protein